MMDSGTVGAGAEKPAALVAALRRLAAQAEHDGTARRGMQLLRRAGWLASLHTDIQPRLEACGRGDLSVGRLFEGHVNALKLVELYGCTRQSARALQDAQGGRLFAVWNTERAPGLRLIRETGGWALRGEKHFASGLGEVDSAIVTAREPAGQVLLVRLDRLGGRGDLSAWQPMGMRASASGRFAADGLPVPPEAIIGQPDDYYREPAFSCGAWRFLAVQLGGMQALFDAMRSQLSASRRITDPHQAARLAEVAIACETAAGWVERARDVAESGSHPADRRVAYVNLARAAVERAALDVIERVGRSVGVAGYLAPNPIERITRDLLVYLRQAAPDGALGRAAGHIARSARPVDALWQA